MVFDGRQAGLDPGGDTAVEVGDVLVAHVEECLGCERGSHAGAAVDDHTPGGFEFGIVARADGIGSELEQSTRDLHGAGDVAFPFDGLADVDDGDIALGQFGCGLGGGDLVDLGDGLG